MMHAIVMLAQLFAPIGGEGTSMSSADSGGLKAETIEHCANLALSCLHREYPNKIAHVLNADADALPPRRLTPVFFGCFDWHSAVHGHWMLVRLCRTHPDGAFVGKARKALAVSFTPERIAAEVSYLNGPGRKSFERPYGLAWLLQLAAELGEWDDVEGSEWSRVLAPLETEAANRFRDWLPKLSHPIRTGEHSQSAFAMGLVYDWAIAARDESMIALIKARAMHYYGNDKNANLAFEPDGQAFLSPIIAEADLMRRVLSPQRFAEWLTLFLPGVGEKSGWLTPAVVTDRTDGKLVHLDGLNLSRAWMLEGIAAGLPAQDKRVSVFRKAAAAHRRAGLSALSNQTYEGGHWLGSFAVYLVTGRGI